MAVVLLSLRLLPAVRVPTSNRRFDVAGAVTITASLMIAVYAIVNGNQEGWTSLQTVGLLAVAFTIFAVFIVIETRVSSPSCRWRSSGCAPSRASSASCGRAPCSRGSS